MEGITPSPALLPSPAKLPGAAWVHVDRMEVGRFAPRLKGPGAVAAKTEGAPGLSSLYSWCCCVCCAFMFALYSVNIFVFLLFSEYIHFGPIVVVLMAITLLVGFNMIFDIILSMLVITFIIHSSHHSHQ